MPRIDNTNRMMNTAAAAGRGRRAGLALLLAGLLNSCSDSGSVTNEAKLQQTPSDASKVLAIIPPSSAIKVGACSNGWCRVSWNGREGYVLTKSIHLSERAFRSMPEPDRPPGEDDTDDASSAAPGEAAPPSSAN
jgi:Bacterial SH3 domain